MKKPQTRINKFGKLFVDRLELINYACDLEEKARLVDRKLKLEFRKAVDGSLIVRLNGKVIVQEHPGVPCAPGGDGDVDREECVTDAKAAAVTARGASSSARVGGATKKSVPKKKSASATMKHPAKGCMQTKLSTRRK